MRVREQSMSALSPRPQSRSRTVRIRKRNIGSTIQEQALAADKNSPRAVQKLELSGSANSPETGILSEPRLARNCPRRRIRVSMQSPACFQVRISVIRSHASFNPAMVRKAVEECSHPHAQMRTIRAFRLRKLGPLRLYRFVPLVKVLLERLRRARRTLRVLRSTLTMLTSQSAALRNSRSAVASLRL